MEVTTAGIRQRILELKDQQLCDDDDYRNEVRMSRIMLSISVAVCISILIFVIALYACIYKYKCVNTNTIPSNNII